MSGNPKRLIAGWFLVVAGAAAALLVVWLSRVVSVPLTTLLTAGAVILALSWLPARSVLKDRNDPERVGVLPACTGGERSHGGAVVDDGAGQHPGLASALPRAR